MSALLYPVVEVSTLLAHTHTVSIDKHWQQNVLTEELSEYQHSPVIGCHLSNKSVLQMSALLELPQATVSAVIGKGKV